MDNTELSNTELSVLLLLSDAKCDLLDERDPLYPLWVIQHILYDKQLEDNSCKNFIPNKQLIKSINNLLKLGLIKKSNLPMPNRFTCFEITDMGMQYAE